MQISIHPPKGKDAFADLERFVQRITRPGNAEIRKVSDAVRQGFAESFAREGSAVGRWAQLADSTVLERVKAGYAGAHPILVREGSLRASYVDRDAEGHVSEFGATATGWMLEEGSEHELAGFHATGTRRMPARPVMPLSAQAEARIGSVLEFIVEQAARATIGR